MKIKSIVDAKMLMRNTVVRLNTRSASTLVLMYKGFAERLFEINLCIAA